MFTWALIIMSAISNFILYTYASVPTFITRMAVVSLLLRLIPLYTLHMAPRPSYSVNLYFRLGSPSVNWTVSMNFRNSSLDGSVNYLLLGIYDPSS